MIKQQRMQITQAEYGQHQQHGAVTKVHLEPAPSKLAGSAKRANEIVVAELLLVGHEKVTVGDIIVLSTSEALQ